MTGEMQVAYCFLCFASSRLMLLLVGVISQLLSGSELNLVDMWYHWDANWYLSIASHGYRLFELFASGSDQTNVNFFPLFPLLMWLASAVFPAKIAGLVVSNCAFFAGCVVMFDFVRRRFGDPIARYSIASICFFPGSFVFSAAMSESLLFLLTVLGFWFAWEKRWPLAAIAGGLLAVTRPNGIFFAISLGCEWLTSIFSGKRQVSYKQLFFIVIIPLPLLIFMVFLFLRFGDAFAFVNSQLYFWGNANTWPLQFLAEIVDFFRVRDVLKTAIALVMMLVFFAQIRRFTVAEASMIVLTFLSITGASSAIRYLLPLFPIHVAIGSVAANERWGPPVLPTLALLNGLMMVFWVRGDAIFI